MRTIDADVLKAGFEEDGHLTPYIESMIDACPTVEAGWISVKDRLPEEGSVDNPNWVLIAVKRKDEEPFAIMDFLVNGEWCGFGNEVTHWMPLSELPKEG